MNMMEMGALPIQKSPEEKPINPEVFMSAAMESSFAVLTEEQENFQLVAAGSERMKELKFGQKSEKVLRGGLTFLLQQFANVPGQSAKDAANYIYDRLAVNIGLMREKYQLARMAH